MATAECAAICLGLTGIEFRGAPLKISRPIVHAPHPAQLQGSQGAGGYSAAAALLAGALFGDVHGGGAGSSACGLDVVAAAHAKAAGTL